MIYIHGCPFACHNTPLQLWTAASACSESLYLACSGSYRPAAPRWCLSTGAPESAAAAQRCPPGKQCLLPAPDQIPRPGNVQGPRPRSARTQPLIPGSPGAGSPSRWQTGSPGQALCQWWSLWHLERFRMWELYIFKGQYWSLCACLIPLNPCFWDFCQGRTLKHFLFPLTVEVAMINSPSRAATMPTSPVPAPSSIAPFPFNSTFPSSRYIHMTTAWKTDVTCI